MLVPLIYLGFLIGAYVITRMFSFLTRKGDRKEHGIVRGMAFFTIAVTIIVIFLLIKLYFE